MNFSCIREIEFKENIFDDENNSIFIVRIEGTYSYDKGDYWNPSSEDFEVESVTFEEDVNINGHVYKKGSNVSNSFLKEYAENPNYVIFFSSSDIFEEEFIVDEPDYDSVIDEFLLKSND